MKYFVQYVWSVEEAWCSFISGGFYYCSYFQLMSKTLFKLKFVQYFEVRILKTQFFV